MPRVSPLLAATLLLAAVLPLAASAPAAADPLTASRLDPDAVRAAKDAAVTGTPRPQLGLPGDVLATAIPIPGVPFTTDGNTCAYVDDYEEVCPFQGQAPDVVYSLSTLFNTLVTVSLCSSLYDTKVFVYENDVSNLVACNDDYCGVDGFRSELMGVPITTGNTYYIVVDGYGTSCGDYTLDIVEFYPELVPCPPGALGEGEPDCADDTDDTWNGGCNSNPPVFEPLPGTPDGGPVSVCGTSGTFLYDGFFYRDTDWYQLDVTQPGTISFEAGANFPLLIALLDGNAGCPVGAALVTATAGSFPDIALMSWDCEAGTYWYWIGPSVFTGIPCGAEYATTITGYVDEGPVAVRPSSWGSLKNGYRR